MLIVQDNYFNKIYLVPSPKVFDPWGADKARPSGGSRVIRWVLSYYCSCNQDKNFSKETDSTTIGIELCKIPQISEHCGLFLRLFNVIE
jgi:hypothetical protein